MSISKYKIEDFQENQIFSLKKIITERDIDLFSQVSGDISPIHMADQFARKKGFKARIAHGVLLAGYVSKLVGVDFPGENALLQSVTMRFLSPAYVGDEIEIIAKVNHISQGVNSVLMEIEIINTASGKKLAQGKVQVGITH